MGVRAINLNDMKEDELRFRILAEIVGADRAPKRADFSAIARKLGTDRQSVAYHVKVLVKQGYLRALSSGYEPTGRILFIEDGTPA